MLILFFFLQIDENGYNGPRGPGDPYDFNDEGLPGMHINSFKRVPIKVFKLIQIIVYFKI